MAEFELLEPEKLYKESLKEAHHKNVVDAFDLLVKRSKINIEDNKETIKKLNSAKKNLYNLKANSKKLDFLLAIFIVLCLAIAGIFLIIFVYKPKKEENEKLIANVESRIKELTGEAYTQMAPLNALFTNSLSSQIMEKTTPLIDMDRIFDGKKYELMRERFGFWDNSDKSTSTLDLQSGNILGNPFVIFKELKQDIVQEVYEGHKTISYSVGFGKNRHTVFQTLTATIKRPKPVYSNETFLVFCSEAANNLSFSRKHSNINNMSEKEIDRYVKKNEKELQRFAEDAMKNGRTYTPLGNSEFELFFNCTNRTNEVEYRLLFTPLAQKSMMQLFKSKEGFGDDFYFKKENGVNIIISEHSNGNTLFPEKDIFKGYDFENIRSFFIDFNDKYFKSIYFDFAPLLCIPLYQQHKAQDYIYKDNNRGNFSCFSHEVIANKYNSKDIIPNNSDTPSIVKTKLISTSKDEDNVEVSAYGFKKIARVEYVKKLGGDGFLHTIPVEWTEYIPVDRVENISIHDLKIDDEVKYRNYCVDNAVYVKGLISSKGPLNMDIEKLKSNMLK